MPTASPRLAPSRPSPSPHSSGPLPQPPSRPSHTSFESTRPRNSGWGSKAPRLAAGGRRLSLHQHEPERRDGETQRVSEAMVGDIFGHHAATIPHVAAAVHLTVAVQQLAVPAALGNTDPVEGSRHRGEVGYHHREVLRVARAADHRDDAVLVVVAIDPAEAGRVEIYLVQRALALVGLIQVLHPALEPS